MQEIRGVILGNGDLNSKNKFFRKFLNVPLFGANTDPRIWKGTVVDT